MSKFINISRLLENVSKIGFSKKVLMASFITFRLSAKDYDILCCNLHEITQLVKSLTKELTEVCKQPPNQQKFGKQFANFLSRYRILLLLYCANHPAAVRVISNHR